MKRKQGFTLVEILIALALVGVLSVIAINTLKNRDTTDEYKAKVNKAVMNIEGVIHEAMYDEQLEEIPSYSDVSSAVTSKLVVRTDGGNYVMKDGTIFSVAATSDTSSNFVAEVKIDANGDLQPNTEGEDIYIYKLTRTGHLVLSSVATDQKTSGNNGSSSGAGSGSGNSGNDNTTSGSSDNTTTGGNDNTSTGSSDSTTTGENDSTSTGSNDSTTTGGNDSTSTGSSDSTTTGGNDSTSAGSSDSTTTGGNDSTSTGSSDSTTTGGNDSTSTGSSDSATTTSGNSSSSGSNLYGGGTIYGGSKEEEGDWCDAAVEKTNKDTQDVDYEVPQEESVEAAERI